VSTVRVADYASWRAEAKRALERGVDPGDIFWVDTLAAQQTLPIAIAAPSRVASADRTKGPAPAPRGTSLSVPRRFVEIATLASCHRHPDKWAVLYRLLWRVVHEGRSLLDVASDDDVYAVEQMAAQVRRDEHKMRAFVRFTRVENASGERYVAWYQPDHLIVRMAAPFFADRYPSMRWSLLTPDLCAHWDLQQLTFSAGIEAPPNIAEEDVADLWRVYYATIFNPARTNISATLREMPLRRWSGLPEASLIPALINSAHERTSMLSRPAAGTSARPYVPVTRELAELRGAVDSCRGCTLFERATQAVFGEGPADAKIVFVGEQPGDVEDRQGRPFVGPAGEVFDRALAAAGIDRSACYVTNAVKHFSFEERGKRRIHKTPRSSEVRACRPWLEAELQSLAPRCVVCLGATATTALIGPQARVRQLRGEVIANTAWAPALVVTVHPSAVLRADDGERYFAMLVADLKLARAALQDGQGDDAPVGVDRMPRADRGRPV
jgi:probable DNA metabolism protein